MYVPEALLFLIVYSQFNVTVPQYRREIVPVSEVNVVV